MNYSLTKMCRMIGPFFFTYQVDFSAPRKLPSFPLATPLYVDSLVILVTVLMLMSRCGKNFSATGCLFYVDILQGVGHSKRETKSQKLCEQNRKMFEKSSMRFFFIIFLVSFYFSFFFTLDWFAPQNWLGFWRDQSIRRLTFISAYSISASLTA